MPNHWKSSTSQPLSTKGRRLDDIEKEEEEKKIEELRTQEILRRMVDLRAGLQNLISTKFIFAHFSTHCRTDENIVVPAEGAIVEMSLETGILQSWHSFLPPGKIPAGSRNDCITKARKTHQISLDDENLFVHSNEDIFEDMINILYNESDGKIRPIFCLSQEKSEIELVLKLLFERSYSSGTAEAKPVPKVYQLEDLIVNIQRSLKASLKDFSSKDQERVKRFLTHFNSPTSVNYKFETAYFDEIPSCPFHEEHFRAEFCSLAIVRTRVFVMMDLLCDILQIAMIDGIHIPRHSQFKAIDIRVQELEESYRDSARTSAEVIPETNLFGTSTGRLGPQNGVTVDLPTNMPEAYFTAKQDQHNHSVFFEDPDADDNDGASLTSSTTVYRSFKGANSSAANISLDSSVLNIDNTTIYEEDTDTESILANSFANVSIGPSQYGDDFDYQRRI